MHLLRRISLEGGWHRCPAELNGGVRRAQFGSYFMTGILFLAGFAGIWVGLERGSSSPETLPILVGAVFLGLGIYLLVLQLRRSEPALGPGAATADNYELERALLAQTARGFYVNGLLGRRPPNDFDRQMLDLFDAIETGASDIHDRIEAVRAYTRRKGFIGSWNDRLKARAVWQHGAAYMRWKRANTPENWLLYKNWNRLYRIGNQTWAGADVTIPKRWVDLAQQPTAGAAPVN